MRNHWYPLAFSTQLPPGKVWGSTLLGDPLVLFRDREGQVVCLEDRCPHRSIPLSLGKMCEGSLECMYHGWRFGSGGECTHLPTLAQGAPIPKASRARAYPCAEIDGLIFVWPGAPEQADVSTITRYSQYYGEGWSLFEGQREFEMDHALMMENLLDPSHVPFTHNGTIGRRQDAGPLEIELLPVEKAGFKGRVRESARPDRPAQFFTFEAPCHLVLDLSLNDKGWKLIQLHYCIPLARNRMRILYRFARNWMTWLPGMNALMLRNSDKIIDQDVEMLMGQQRRLEEGARAWGCPVKADLMAVKYRKWLEENATDDVWWQGWGTAVKRPPHPEGLSPAAGA